MPGEFGYRPLTDEEKEERDAREEWTRMKMDPRRRAELERHEKEQKERKEAEHQRAVAEAEKILAPIKQSEKRKYLLAHPSESERDFENRAWPLILESYIEPNLERVKAAKRASGIY